MELVKLFDYSELKICFLKVVSHQALVLEHLGVDAVRGFWLFRELPPLHALCLTFYSLLVQQNFLKIELRFVVEGETREVFDSLSSLFIVRERKILVHEKLLLLLLELEMGRWLPLFFTGLLVQNFVGILNELDKFLKIFERV